MPNSNKNNDAWLLDAEVRSKIEQNKGRWEVSLVFIDTKDPNHILVRKIGDYHSEALANIYANNMKKSAAKDKRGTQKIDPDAHRFNNN